MENDTCTRPARFKPPLPRRDGPVGEVVVRAGAPHLEHAGADLAGAAAHLLDDPGRPGRLLGPGRAADDVDLAEVQVVEVEAGMVTVVVGLARSHKLVVEDML